VVAVIRQRAVLCVDDDPAMLQVLVRTLSPHFDVMTEDRGMAALQRLERGEREFVAIVSDMQMPLMDGAAFLSYAAKLTPKSTRVLLTGLAELEVAIAAVNTGQIFRFLRKPCAPHDLLAAVEAAAEQYRLVTVEQRLLEQTLTGGVRLLCEVFALLAPRVCGQNDRLQAYVLHLAKKLGRKDSWRFELAACLNMVGYVGLPEETLNHFLSGALLDADELRQVAEQPRSAHALLNKIPHFEDLAEMIRLQSPQPSDGDGAPADVLLGASMLRVASGVARLVAAGATESEAVASLVPRATPRDLELLRLLEDYRGALPRGSVKELRVPQMTTLMTPAENITTRTGVVVVPMGKQLNAAILERLLRFSRAAMLVEPIRVLVPD